MKCRLNVPCSIGCPIWQECTDAEKKDTVREPLGYVIIPLFIISALIILLIFGSGKW
jgi:hypothetical protein